jgi:hypothetical protein
VEIKTKSIDLDLIQSFGGRALQILHKSRRKSVCAAICEIDDYAFRCMITARSRRARFSFKYFAPEGFGCLKLTVSYFGDECASILSETHHDAQSPPPSSGACLALAGKMAILSRRQGAA